MQLYKTMTELVFATNNAHKLREIREMAGSHFRILSLADAGVDAEIPENQYTLEGNAREKARFIFEKTGRDCFADDTGLEIEALAGRPGVYSARYAGEGCSFDDNIAKVLKEMKTADNRNARFRCVVCLIFHGTEYLFEGNVKGTILRERRGAGGFGYDPIFLPDGYPTTFAEMPAHLKNGISHRGKAVTKMLRSFAAR
jgi:XTP/dITP diphosphohydrolase